jgi:hypothetical protein
LKPPWRRNDGGAVFYRESGFARPEAKTTGLHSMSFARKINHMFKVDKPGSNCDHLIHRLVRLVPGLYRRVAGLNFPPYE